MFNPRRERGIRGSHTGFSSVQPRRSVLSRAMASYPEASSQPLSENLNDWVLSCMAGPYLWVFRNANGQGATLETVLRLWPCRYPLSTSGLRSMRCPRSWRRLMEMIEQSS
jgi:hypothetical protein